MNPIVNFANEMECIPDEVALAEREPLQFLLLIMARAIWENSTDDCGEPVMRGIERSLNSIAEVMVEDKE